MALEEAGEELVDLLYVDMLMDLERNSAYSAALMIAVADAKTSAGVAGVIDVGTGVGLLAMMAARAGADWVVACETRAQTAELARLTVEKNGLQDQVKVLPLRSTNMVKMKVSPNICVAEIFDSELLGEGALRSLRDVGERLVTSNCRFVPATATVWAVPVASSLFRRIRFPGGSSGIIAPEIVQQCPGLRCPIEWNFDQMPPGAIELLAKEQQIFHFDFAQLHLLSADSFQGRTEVLTPQCGKATDAWLVFWTLDMTGDGRIKLSTIGSPNSPARQHWLPLVYPVDAKSNHFTFFHDEFSIWMESGQLQQPTTFGCYCGMHTTLSRLEMARFNDPSYMPWAVSFAQANLRDRRCLFVGNFSVLPLIAVRTVHVRSAMYVTLEQREAELMSQYIKANHLDSKISVICIDEFCNVDFEDCDCLISCFSSEGANDGGLWADLRFWPIARRFLELKSWACKTKIFPNDVHLWCLPLRIKDINRLMIKSISEVDGFDMSVLNELIVQCYSKSSTDFHSIHLWEVDHLALSDPQKLVGVEATVQPASVEILLSVNRMVEKPNAMAFWLEWSYGDAENSLPERFPFDQYRIGSKPDWPIYGRQAVLPLECTVDDKYLRIKSKFLPEQLSFHCCVIPSKEKSVAPENGS